MAHAVNFVILLCPSVFSNLLSVDLMVLLECIIPGTRADTAKTKDISDNSSLLGQLPTVKIVAYCQDSCILSRKLYTVKTVAYKRKREKSLFT